MLNLCKGRWAFFRVVWRVSTGTWTKKRRLQERPIVIRYTRAYRNSNYQEIQLNLQQRKASRVLSEKRKMRKFLPRRMSIQEFLTTNRARKRFCYNSLRKLKILTLSRIPCFSWTWKKGQNRAPFSRPHNLRTSRLPKRPLNTQMLHKPIISVEEMFYLSQSIKLEGSVPFPTKLNKARKKSQGR